MADTVFYHGNPKRIDHTPTAGDVAMGEVVVLDIEGVSCGIAARAITNNAKGSLDVGEAVYTVVNLDNAADNEKVWWNDSVKKVTTTSTNNALFGYVVQDGALGANTNCRAMHNPYV